VKIGRSSRLAVASRPAGHPRPDPAPSTVPDTDAPAVGDALACARPGDDVVDRAMIRARVAAALFDEPVQPIKIGRFQLLQRVGRGGMGVVYAAYDPDLDRRVALKLVPVDDRETRDRWLAEAKALASLSHPHVVPVHDVDVVNDRICIVMEFVAGKTLRAWCDAPGRSWGAILEVYRQAGEGLDAAHRAGLVHRDFKPDNAIVGADHRVRVVDFGLARTVGHAVADGAGTPRYMAPEQSSGAALTPAADQYAFCMSLREALGERAPRWIADAIDRGAAIDPAARYATMTELLRALVRDPARIRRRRWMAAGFAGAIAGAAAIAVSLGRDPGVAPCSGGPAEIGRTWDAASKRAVEARLAAAGTYGAELAPRATATLDDYAATWAGSHRAACQAHRRGEQTGELLDRRMACLDRGRGALGALIGVLSTVEPAAVPDAMLAVAALPDLARCDDASALLAPIDPPPPAVAAQVARLDTELARADVVLAAGRADEARRLATGVVAGARDTAYRPLVARALLVVGRAEIALDGRERAAGPLREATLLALAAGDRPAAVEAFARWAWVTGSATGGEPVLPSVPFFAALGESAEGAGGAFPVALLHNNAGSVELAAGHRDRARDAFEAALAAASAVPPPAPIELANIPTNLALVVDDPARRAALFADAIDQLTRAVGADHPLTLATRVTAGRQTDGDDAAAAALAPTCAALERLHPTDGAARIAPCWFEVGWLAYHRGATDEAVAAFTAAAAVADAQTPARAALIRGYLALARGDAKAARAVFADARAALSAGDDAPWYVRALAGELDLGLAQALRAAGDRRGARDAFGRAAAALTTVVATQPLPSFARRLARANEGAASP
jgi:eukaryotic-like serine/threonine-protein kinase